MRLFLTGATGVHGRATVPLLHEQGHEVVAAVRSAASAERAAALGAAPTVVDVFDCEALIH